MQKEELEQFIIWTKLKIRIHSQERKVFFKEREIWWCSLGKNIGFEQDGKNELFERPVLVMKKFNHETLWVLPLTRTQKNSKYYFCLDQCGENSFIILSQLRLISSRRLLRKMRTIKEQEFHEIKKAVAGFIQ